MLGALLSVLVELEAVVLVTGLGNEQFAVRQASQEALVALNNRHGPLLAVVAALESDDAEVRDRAAAVHDAWFRRPPGEWPSIDFRPPGSAVSRLLMRYRYEKVRAPARLAPPDVDSKRLQAAAGFRGLRQENITPMAIRRVYFEMVRREAEELRRRREGDDRGMTLAQKETAAKAYSRGERKDPLAKKCYEEMARLGEEMLRIGREENARRLKKEAERRQKEGKQ